MACNHHINAPTSASLGENAAFDGDAGLSQPLAAAPATGVGSSTAKITRATPASINASTHGGVAPSVVAGFEAADHRRVPPRARRHLPPAARHDLGVLAAGGPGLTFADDVTGAVEDDRAQPGGFGLNLPEGGLAEQ